MPTLSLSGPWQITWTDGQHGNLAQFLQPVADPARYLPAQFPGTLHASLERAGLVDDPRLGVNSLKERWVEEQYWILRKTFEVPAGAAGGPAWLRIGVLDGVAELALNGEKIGAHASSHRPAGFDLTGRLRPGENELVILLESGLFAVADLPARAYSQNLETVLVKRYHLRRAQYQFGWDWNPRFPSIGLHGAIEVTWGAEAWIEQVAVLGEVAADLASATIRLRPSFRNLGEGKTARLRVSSQDGLAAEAEIALPAGASEAEIALPVPQPALWWPRGHGPQPLYPLALTVTVDGADVARWEGRTGLRRVELHQPQHPVTGRYFHLVVNNRPIFCKGANWVPPELWGHDVAPEKVRALVELAVAENMNTLRLWGGGVWANHDMLAACDETGILVWHDFLFACAKFPADRPEFLAEAAEEVAWGAREFSPHPALAVWCGSNEIETGTWNWGYKKFGPTAPDYVLFHQVMPTLLREIDPTRPYWPSSPYSSPSENPDEPTVGDQHPWKVSLGADDVNFWAYRQYVDRFPNEGGVLGCAPVASLAKFLRGEELAMRSFAWEHHDNTILYWHARPGVPLRATEHWLGKPAAEMDLETYTLASGLLQAEGLKEYILNYRCRWPSTGSAIYWMFNDSWPTVHGWGTFDYYLNRKLAFHPVRRAFAPLALALADEGAEIGVYVLNDTGAEQAITAQAGSFLPDGDARWQEFTASVPPYTSQRIAALPRDPSRIYGAVLRDGAGKTISQDRLLLQPWKEWALADPQIEVQPGEGVTRYQSPVWVWGVVLDPTGQEAVPDDVFDLLPGVPYGIEGPPRPVQATGNGLVRG